jgi:hypothetical protein
MAPARDTASRIAAREYACGVCEILKDICRGQWVYFLSSCVQTRIQDFLWTMTGWLASNGAQSESDMTDITSQYSRQNNSTGQTPSASDTSRPQIYDTP